MELRVRLLSKREQLAPSSAKAWYCVFYSLWLVQLYILLCCDFNAEDEEGRSGTKVARGIACSCCYAWSVDRFLENGWLFLLQGFSPCEKQRNSIVHNVYLILNA